MIKNRHEILAEIIKDYENTEKCSCYSDLQRIFVRTLSLLGECIGYIDAVNAIHYTQLTKDSECYEICERKNDD